MRNRCKTLLRDHSVLKVTLKTCPRHYSVSAIPETLTVQGPNRPPTSLPLPSEPPGVCGALESLGPQSVSGFAFLTPPYPLSPLNLLALLSASSPEPPLGLWGLRKPWGLSQTQGFFPLAPPCPIFLLLCSLALTPWSPWGLWGLKRMRGMFY